MIVGSMRARARWQTRVSVVAVLCTTWFAALPWPRPRPEASMSQLANVAPARDIATNRVDTHCLRVLSDVRQSPALPGAPEFEQYRPEIVARARSAEVVYLKAPEAQATTEKLQRLRAALFRGSTPWLAFRQIYADFRHDPRRLREALLTEGYLYADRPGTAAILGNSVILSHLFDAPVVEVMRGNDHLRAQRRGNEYYWTSGSDEGRPAQLWLSDRVRLPNEPWGPSRHVSLARVREQTNCDRVEVERITETRIAVRLIYGNMTIPAILSRDNSDVSLECMAPAAPEMASLEDIRSINSRKSAALAKLKDTILSQVREALPFDEPKTEEGQQDGKLRIEWRSAYLNGKYTFDFNGDTYPVFGNKGEPRTPQVCADFIVDTWERLSGTHWRRRNEPRGRVVGRLDFSALEITNRRSVDHLIEYARNKPQWFEVLEYPDRERIPFSERQRFFERVYRQRSEFQPGDVVAILGLRDDERLHYHSFMIVSNDVITGMPTSVASNAGRPRIRSWESEMQNAPRRSIIARIRPRLGWLESLLGAPAEDPMPDARSRREAYAPATAAPLMVQN